MRLSPYWLLTTSALLWIPSVQGADQSGQVLPPINERFAQAGVEESPSFQRHVVNLFGRLGCNGRACHGSFQGRGGFQLSLFGYDFKADHAAMFDKDSPRVDLENPDESLIIAKPTDEGMHEGGQRYELGSWQHHVLRRWIESGAKVADQPEVLVRLEVTPAEIWFRRGDEQVQLQVVAVWEDDSREDVTPLCRFQSNSSQVAEIDQTGLVTAGEPGDTHVVIFYDNGVVPVPVIQPVSKLAGERYPPVETPTRIDELVVQKLRKLGVVPSELCSDAEFLRRVRLDMTGTLPTPGEVASFLADESSGKRAKKVDELLETPAYAAWWATKLCDFTGNNDDQLTNVSVSRSAGSQEWYEWIHHRVEQNVPYDELAAGIVTAVSRSGDQDYLDYCREMSEIYKQGSDKSFADLDGMTHYWARRDFRDPDARAIGFAYSFMGLRIQCAQCHKHPFDQWSKDDFHQFKEFFTSVTTTQAVPRDPDDRKQYNQLVQELGLNGKRGNDLRREIPSLLKQGKTVPFPEVTVVKPRPAGKNAPPPTAKLLGGEVVDLTQYDDPRTELMQWLRSPDNRFFAPAFVNRVWASYFNVGIVSPPDDISLANPPSNRPLLDYLSQGFVESGFDMKWVHRQIANSRTYQASWKPNETNRGDEKNFSRAVPRRLPAEVVYDAIQQATASDARVAAMHGELDGRAIAIPGAGTRYTGNRNAVYALTVFGRSTRDSNCDCDRSAEASLLQTVYLQNDSDVLALLETRPGTWLDQVARQSSPQRTVDNGNAAGQIKRIETLLASGRQKLKQAERAGDDAQVKSLKQRIAAGERQLAALQKQPDAPPPAKTESPDATELITQAYLRTLCRYPTDSERASSQAYLAQADTAADGLRDLLWALLNTKEFIVNH